MFKNHCVIYWNSSSEGRSRVFSLFLVFLGAGCWSEELTEISTKVETEATGAAGVAFNTTPLPLLATTGSGPDGGGA